MANELTPMQKELLSRADSIFDSIAKAAAKTADVAVGAANTAIDFAKEQLPDIAYQYIAMERAYLSILILVGVVFGVLSLYMLFSVMIKDKFKLGYDRMLLLFPVGIFGFISSTIILTNLKDFLMVWFAPKIFIITNIVHLMKG